jgi:hypothetical protein
MCGPYVVTPKSIRTHISDWYLARLVLMNREYKDAFYNEIGLYAHHFRFNIKHYWAHKLAVYVII